MERDFKGVWIPKEVWLDARLSALDKVILTEIDSLDQGERGCYASNQYIAEFCQCSTTKVSTSVSKLIEYGYLYVQKFDGRQRELKSRLSISERQDVNNLKADVKKVKDTNISTNTSNNTKNIYEHEFEELWKLYPKKQGKANALTAYIKARKKGVTEEQVKTGLERYVKYIEDTNTPEQYIKHGSTWFNQGCWDDEYRQGQKQRRTDAFHNMTSREYDWDAIEKMGASNAMKKI